ncbi:hypothetical protein HPB50_010067 [Hyalomma asiaticum]|uniref:Uncharacterized protein n=1 Tax=Hyalomma asiaticum TaxID=266040 RepID=A0ACB7RY22_HYAAI|nr:hypothetical protein HPB50_010067 [Hyalomma asiaticum]
MCQANLNDLVPCTVSPLAVDCYQGKGSCCRGACVCHSYPNPCIVETNPYMVGRRKRAALARSYNTETSRCRRSCLLECKTPYCSPGSNRNACKKACLRLCLEECNDNLV